MLPEAAQARKAIWEAINPHSGKRRIDEAFPRELRANTKDQEMMIRFVNGSTWQVLGSDNYNSLVGSPPAGVVFSEWALANPAARAYLRPIFAENNGWQLYITTPRGKNHAYKTFEAGKKTPGTFAQRLTAYDTGAISIERLAAEKQAYIDDYGIDQGTALFEQEYLCSFDAALLGAYYGKEMRLAEDEGRVCEVKYDPAVPVHTAWDLGYSDDTGIWWYQVIGGEIHVLEYYGAAGQDMKYYFERIAGREILNKEWQIDINVPIVYGKVIPGLEHRAEYRYGMHNLPHDARAKTLASMGRSIQEMCWKAFGSANVRIVPDVGVQSGIQASRMAIGRAYFDAAGTEGGVDALKQYQREWDDDKKVFRETPRHDWCFTGATKILTRYGTHQIMGLPNTGEVLTSCGWKRYTNPRVTRKNAQLVEVAFAGGYTVRCTPDHLFKTVNGWKSAESLTRGMQIQSTLTLSRSILMAAYTVFGRAITTIHAAARSCIATLGLRRLGQFLRDVISTIRTATRATTPCRISSALTQKSTFRSLGKIMGLSALSISPRMPVARPPNGMDRKLEGYGTAATQNASRAGRNGSAKTCLASIAERFLAALSGRVATLRSIVQISARWPLIGRVVLAQKPVRVIESVKKLSSVEDVWCLTVPDAEEFSLSNGAVVHNCSHAADSFRMLAVAWREEYKPKEPEKPRFPTDQTINELIAAQRRKRQE